MKDSSSYEVWQRACERRLRRANAMSEFWIGKAFATSSLEIESKREKQETLYREAVHLTSRLWDKVICHPRRIGEMEHALAIADCWCLTLGTTDRLARK